MNWLKSLFSALDSTAPATDRINAALSGIADDLEAVRGHVRTRFGLDDDSWKLQVISATAAAPAALPPAGDFAPDVATTPRPAPTPKRGKK
jgi:hypothetical protein